jgi:hypothetical protein
MFYLGPTLTCEKKYYQRLPLELLEEIAKLAIWLRQGNRLMQTCVELHDVIARELYRDVTIDENTADKFFQTVTNTERHYGLLVKSLKISTIADIFSENCSNISYMIISDATPHLPNVTFLKFDLHWMVALSFQREIQEEMDNALTDNRHFEHPTFASVNSLDICGEIDLLHFAKVENLVTLIINEDLDNFNELNSLLNHLSVAKRLKHLFLSLELEISMSIRDVIIRVGRALTGLEIFNICTPFCKALVGIHFMLKIFINALLNN